MQNISDWSDEIREKKYKMKMEQYFDVIAESKISLIKLNHFANSKGLFDPIMLKWMFIGFKTSQWFSIVTIVVYFPYILFYQAQATNISEMLEFLLSGYKSMSSIWLVFSISICGTIIGFLGVRYAKLQLQIESNRDIARELADEIDENLRLAEKHFYG